MAAKKRLTKRSKKIEWSNRVTRLAWAEPGIGHGMAESRPVRATGVAGVGLNKELVLQARDEVMNGGTGVADI